MSVGYSQPCLHDQNIGFRISMGRPRFTCFISEICILHYMVFTYILYYNALENQFKECIWSSIN